MLALMVVRSWLKLPTQNSRHSHRGLPRPRFAGSIGVSISLGLALTAVGARLTSHGISESISDCPCAPKNTNLVFIIDRSGSMQNVIDSRTDATSSLGRGQTDNVEIEGVRQALLNSSVIPRDGSVSVGVVLFDGTASVPLRLTQRIASDAEALALAAQVEALRCVDIAPPCTVGNTSFDAAIRQADQLAQSRPADRRLLIMSTDGEANDADKGKSGSLAFLRQAENDGVDAELDVILIGLDDAPDNNELTQNKETVSAIVIPSAPNPLSAPSDPPGAVEVIEKSACNKPGNKVFGTECDCQVRQFVDFTRRALRSSVALRDLTVNTLDDPDPNTPVPAGGPMSLRQAIEAADSNGGRARISFQKGGTIHPRIPLPALTAPDITICGCADDCAASIPDKVTCPQPLQGQENVCVRMVTIDGQIDAQRKLADGIVIRSNRDVVRGLRIINFSHAGIVIQPVCPCDNTGFNRIELNSLENNATAGLCVLDPLGKGFAVTHNISNTISMNDISGSLTPIDLACDGRTQNDDRDLDEGPNTLLNYPEPFSADTIGNTVTITGRVNIPTVECPVNDTAVIEVFAVTKIHPESGLAAVDAVTFFGRITLDESGGGAFSMKFAKGSLSPCDGYTATFSDRAGNTSELIPFCTGPPKPKLTRNLIEFKQVDPSGEPNSAPQSEPFAVENCGCSKLELSLISIEREGNDVGRLRNRDDSVSKKGSGFFRIRQVNDTGQPREIPIDIPKNNIAIGPGTSQRFSIEFNPVIPRVIVGETEKSKSGLLARHVLPADVRSTLNLKLNSGVASKVSLIGHVTKAVKLIDPDAPSNPAKVTFTRAGDELTVIFSVFDSNLDVKRIAFQFLDKAGGTVPLQQSEDDLTPVIQQRNLVTGQSFSIIKRFSNAKKHPEVDKVIVTVTDGETSVSATSGSVVNVTTMNSRLFKNRGSMTLMLQVVRLPQARAEDR